MGSVDSAPPLGSAQSVSPSFAHTQPAYQSVNFGDLQYNNNERNRLTGTTSDYTIGSYMTSHKQTPDKKTGLLKWKGQMMPPEENEVSPEQDEIDSVKESSSTDEINSKRSHKQIVSSHHDKLLSQF